MEEVRLGTIGSGVIVHSVLDGARETEGIRLEAVHSRAEDKGRALAAEYGAQKVYTDMDAFLAGGALMDINFYNVYLNVALFGKPASASYAANLHDLGGGSIDTSGVKAAECRSNTKTQGVFPWQRKS